MLIYATTSQLIWLYEICQRIILRWWLSRFKICEFAMRIYCQSVFHCFVIKSSEMAEITENYSKLRKITQSGKKITKSYCELPEIKFLKAK